MLIFPCFQAAPDIGGAQGSLSPASISNNQECGRRDRCSSPAFDTSVWTAESWTSEANNCYNYAVNQVTNTFAQPGRAASSLYTALTGEAVRNASVFDGMLDHEDPDPGDFPGGRNCMTALVIIPGVDFHFYRLDDDDTWSHKPSKWIDPVTVDNSGASITDPRTADIAPYKFVRFLSTCPVKMYVN